MWVQASVELEPTYVVNAIGQRPDGLRNRLAWERGVDLIERHRQRLGVRDPERALGPEPDEALARARWREARREVDVIRTRVTERGQDRTRALSLGTEIGLDR